MLKNIFKFSIFFLTISCSSSNTDYSNDNQKYQDTETGNSDVRFDNEGISINNRFSNLENEMTQTSENYTSYLKSEKELNLERKNNKIDYNESQNKQKSLKEECVKINKNKDKLVNDYLKLYEESETYIKKANLNWLDCLQDLLDDAKIDNIYLEDIHEDKRFKKAKSGSELKETLNQIKQNQRKLRSFLKGKKLINNDKTFESKEEKLKKIDYYNRALIELSTNILKIIDLIQDEDILKKNPNKIKKHEIENLIKEIENNKDAYDNLKSLNDKNRTLELEQKEIKYGKSLNKALDKIKEYINYNN